MAEISISNVQAARTNPKEFGSVTNGTRIYLMQYNLPGIPSMDGQTHIVPLAALANHKLDTSEIDPMQSMMVMLQDYMSMHQTVSSMGQRAAQSSDDSPLVKTAIALQDLHVSLDTGAQTLAASVPMSTIDDAHSAVQDTFVSNATPVRLAKMKTGVSQFKAAVGKVQVARTSYTGIVSPIVGEHSVDTSLKTWATLTQMVADDTDEFATEQTDWFNHRFGRNIKYIAGQRLIQARQKVAT